MTLVEQLRELYQGAEIQEQKKLCKTVQEKRINLQAELLSLDEKYKRLQDILKQVGTAASRLIDEEFSRSAQALEVRNQLYQSHRQHQDTFLNQEGDSQIITTYEAASNTQIKSALKNLYEGARARKEVYEQFQPSVLSYLVVEHEKDKTMLYLSVKFNQSQQKGSLMESLAGWIQGYLQHRHVEIKKLEQNGRYLTLQADAALDKIELGEKPAPLRHANVEMRIIALYRDPNTEIEQIGDDIIVIKTDPEPDAL